jgi:hypothetical protein
VTTDESPPAETTVTDSASLHPPIAQEPTPTAAGLANADCRAGAAGGNGEGVTVFFGSGVRGVSLVRQGGERRWQLIQVAERRGEFCLAVITGGSVSRRHGAVSGRV